MMKLLFSSLPIVLPLLAVSGMAAAQRAPVVDPANNPAVRFPNAVQRVPGPPGMGPAVPLSALQADFRARSGSDTVQFGRDAYLLDEAARQVLARQADWLRMNPMLRANIEGHADVRHTREYALALAERRAAAVHSFLLAQGVSPAQLTVISWGKERPAVEGAHDATWLQNSRVVTVLAGPALPAFAPPLPPMN